ncbi:MAG: 50S ribosomal protein L24 [Candidatus Thermoplasmatota archaeon]|nr:50S ribosomal protein L24 [Candidatus Thermoplasmatota archaeon]
MMNYVDVAVSKELRKKYDIRSIPICKGDIVKVKSGKLKGEGGKVINVDHSKGLVSVEGVTSTKADGKQKERKMKPQKLVITKIDFSRQERLDRIRRVAQLKNFTITEPTPEELAPAPEEKPAEPSALEDTSTGETVAESPEASETGKESNESEDEFAETEELSLPDEEPEVDSSVKDAPDTDGKKTTRKSTSRSRKKPETAEDSDNAEETAPKKRGRKKVDKQD